MYYSVRDNGDGSVSVEFYESLELAAFFDDEWGESSTGKVPLKAQTVEGIFWQNLVSNYRNFDFAKFVKEFFPDGIPHYNFCIKTVKDKRCVIVTGVGEFYTYSNITIEEIETLIKRMNELEG